MKNTTVSVVCVLLFAFLSPGMNAQFKIIRSSVSTNGDPTITEDTCRCTPFTFDENDGEWFKNLIRDLFPSKEERERRRAVVRQIEFDLKTNIEGIYKLQFDDFEQARDHLLKEYSRTLLSDGPGKFQAEVIEREAQFNMESTHLSALEFRGREIGNGILNSSLGTYRIDGVSMTEIQTIEELRRTREKVKSRYDDHDNFLNANGEANLVKGVSSVKELTDTAAHFGGLSIWSEMILNSIRFRTNSFEKIRDYIIAVKSLNPCPLRPGECGERAYDKFRRTGRIRNADPRDESRRAAVTIGKGSPRHMPTTRSIESMQKESAFGPDILGPEGKAFLDQNAKVRQAVENFYKNKAYNGKSQAVVKRVFREAFKPNGSLKGAEDEDLYRTWHNIKVRSATLKNTVRQGTLFPATAVDGYSGVTDITGAFQENPEHQRFAGTAIRGFFCDNGSGIPGGFPLSDAALSRYFEFQDNPGSKGLIGLDFKNDLGTQLWDGGLQTNDAVFEHLNKVEGIGNRYGLTDVQRGFLSTGIDFVKDLAEFLATHTAAEDKEEVDKFAQDAIRDFNEGREVDFDAFNFDPCASIAGLRAKDDGLFEDKIDELKGKLKERREFGFQDRFEGPGKDKHLPLSPTRNAEGEIISNLLDVDYNSNTKGWMHTHYEIKNIPNGDGTFTPDGLVPMFSPGDVALFLDIIDQVNKSDNDMREVYGTVVTEKGTFMMRFTGDQRDVAHNNEARQRLKREQAKNFGLDKTYRKYLKLGNEIGFLRFLKFNMNVRGIELFELGKNNRTTKFKFKADSNFLSLEKEDC